MEDFSATYDQFQDAVMRSLAVPAKVITAMEESSYSHAGRLAAEKAFERHTNTWLQNMMKHFDAKVFGLACECDDCEERRVTWGKLMMACSGGTGFEPILRALAKATDEFDVGVAADWLEEHGKPDLANKVRVNPVESLAAARAAVNLMDLEWKERVPC